VIEWWYRPINRWPIHNDGRCLGGTILITKHRHRVGDSQDCRIKPSLNEPLGVISVKSGGFEKLIEYRRP
jgi:hypothetical protein